MIYDLTMRNQKNFEVLNVLYLAMIDPFVVVVVVGIDFDGLVGR